MAAGAPATAPAPQQGQTAPQEQTPEQTEKQQTPADAIRKMVTEIILDTFQSPKNSQQPTSDGETTSAKGVQNKGEVADNNGKPVSQAQAQTHSQTTESDTTKAKKPKQENTDSGNAPKAHDTSTVNNTSKVEQTKTTDNTVNSNKPSEKQLGDANITVSTSSHSPKPSTSKPSSLSTPPLTSTTPTKQPETKKAKGFFGKIADGIKKGVNGAGSGIGKITNRFVQKCKNNAAPSAYTDRRKYPDEILRKFPTGVVRKLFFEPLTLPIAGIGSLLSGDGSYFKNAWKRLRGRDEQLATPKVTIDEKKQAQAATADLEKEEGELISFKPNDKTKAAQENKDGKVVSFNQQDKTKAAQEEKMAKSVSFKPNDKTKAAQEKEGNTVSFNQQKTTDTFKAGDKFYYNHDGDLLTYEVTGVDKDTIHYVDHDSDNPKEIHSLSKEDFTEMITNGNYYQNAA